MKAFLKNNFIYFFLFFFYFFCLTISYNLFFGDSIVNFGFSYGIVNGQIPYKDYNMIIPIFSPLIYAIPLFIYKSSIVFYLTQAFFLTILSKLLYKLLGNKSYIYLPIVFLCFPISIVTAIFPGYNFMLFFLVIILIYLEEEKSNDYLIGIILGILILTKHTIGIFFILPSFIYIKQIKKIGKRIIGASIPCIVFVVYLLITHSLSEFIHLAILGLFDFASSNGYVQNIFLVIVFFLCVCICIRYIYKNKKDITGYYIFLLSIMAYPILDDYHISYFILGCLYLVLKTSSIDLNKTLSYFLLFSLFLSIMWLFITIYYKEGTYIFKNYNHYPMRYINKQSVEDFEELDKYISESKHEVVLMSIGTENYFYKITNDLDLTYFDLPNYGNYGYSGEEIMKKKIDDLKDGTIILISPYMYENLSVTNQYDKEIIRYIINNFRKGDKVGRWISYVKK